VVVLVASAAAWLNLPPAAILFARGFAQSRHPVIFDVELANVSPALANVDVTLLYMPKTPIYGISEHYTNMLSPLTLDRVVRHLNVTVTQGRLHFQAPLALVGLSNFRLDFVTLQRTNSSDAPELFGLTDTGNGDAPITSAIPSAHVADGTYFFDGPLALWRMTGDSDDAGGRAYSPLGSNPSRQVIWDGLRAVHARVNFAPYPIPTFQVPVEWARYGWRRYGNVLFQRNAKLSDTRLSMTHGAALVIPFTRDCARTPEFALVRKPQTAPWADDVALWAPISLGAWQKAVRTHRAPRESIAFVPAGKRSEEPDAVRVGPLQRGEYRLCAACPNTAYDSVAVAWIDVAVL